MPRAGLHTRQNTLWSCRATAVRVANVTEKLPEAAEKQTPAGIRYRRGRASGWREARTWKTRCHAKDRLRIEAS